MSLQKQVGHFNLKVVTIGIPLKVACKCTHTAQTSCEPQSDYHGCRQAEETEVMIVLLRYGRLFA